MTKLITLNTTTAMLEETLATIDAAGRITVVQTTPATDNELVTRAYVLAQGGAFLAKSANLSDVAAPATARTNLGWTNGTAGLAAMNVLGTAGARIVTDWTAADAGGTGFVKGATSATNGPVAATAFVGQWVASDAANGVLTLVGLVAGAYNVWTRRRVAGTWDQWTQAYDSAGYALLNAANIFLQAQTIRHASAATLTLDDNNAVVGSSKTARIIFNATGVEDGSIGYGNSGGASSVMTMVANQNHIQFDADPNNLHTTTLITFKIDGAEVGRLEAASGVVAATAIITKAAGDVRYLQLAGGTMLGQVKGITPVAAADLTRKDYVDAGDAGRLSQSQGDARYLQLTGGTLTGALSVDPAAGDALLTLDIPAAGKGAFLRGAVAGNMRWNLSLGDGAAETGGNVGSNFSLQRFSDTGVWLGNPLTIGRATGAAQFEVSGAIGGRVDAKGTAIVDADTLMTAQKADFRYLALTGGTMTGQIKGLTPVVAADVATKGYVDSAISGGGTTGVFADGSAGAPSITFVADLDTGFFHPTGDQNIIGIALAGAETARFVPTALRLGNPLNVAGTGGALEVSGITQAAASISLSKFSNDAAPSYIFLNKSKSAALGGFAAVSASDNLGIIYFRGSDGTALIGSSFMQARVDAATTTGNVFSALLFGTLAAGTPGVLTERMRLTSGGILGVGRTTPDAKTLLDVAGPIRTGSYTIATLPTQPVAAGTQAWVADAPGGGAMAESDGAKWVYGQATAAGFPVGIPFSLKNLDTEAITGGIYAPYGGAHAAAATGDNPYPTWGGSFLLFAQKHGAGLVDQYITQIAMILGSTTAAATMRMRYKSNAAWSAWFDIHTSDGAMDGTVTAPAYSFKGDTNTGLYRIGTDSLGVAVGGLEVARFEANNAFYRGTPAALAGVSANTIIASTGALASAQGQVLFATGAGGVNFYLGHSKNAAVGDFTAASAADDQLGNIFFMGSDTAKMVSGAQIRGYAEGTPALNSMPGRLGFYVGDTAGTLRERLRISSDGTSLFYGPAGVASARVEAAGSTITNTDGLTVITQQKGDLRYALTGTSGTGVFPDGSAGSPSITFTGDTNTGLFHIAGDTGIVAVSSNGVEVARFDGAALYRGVTGPITGVVASTVIAGAVGSADPASNLALWKYSTDNAGPVLYLAKSRSAAHAALSLNDSLGNITFTGADGTQQREAARIRGYVDGAILPTIVPGGLAVHTNDFSGTSRLRMTIDSTGTALFYVNNFLAGRIDATGGTASNSDGQTLMTREKGDVRYLVTTGVEADFAKVNAANKFTATQTISNGAPIIVFENTGNALDLKRWRIGGVGSSTAFAFFPQLDDGTTITASYLSLQRDATGVTDLLLKTQNATLIPNASSVLTQERADGRYLNINGPIVGSKSTIVEGDNIFPDFNMVDAGLYASSAGTLFTFSGTSSALVGTRFMNLPVDAALLGVVEAGWVTCEVSTEYLVSGAVWMASGAVGAGTVSLFVETGSVASNGVITSLGRTLISSKTDTSTIALAALNLTTAATARVMRLVVERTAGGTQIARAGAYSIRRKVKAAQMAADVQTANDARYLVTTGVEADFAKIAAANVFTQNQTIGTTSPVLILNDTDATLGGTPTANILVRSGANTGTNNQGLMGFNGSNLMLFYNYNGSIRLTAATAGNMIAFYVGAAEVGRLDDLGTLPAPASIITKATGDARYALAGTPGTSVFPDGSAGSPSITFIGDTDTGLFHPTGNTNVVGIATNGAEYTRFSGSTFYRGLGVNAQLANLAADAIFAGTAGQSSAMALARFSADVSPPTIFMGKSHNATVGDYTTPVAAEDELARFNFVGSDSVKFISGAQIRVYAEGVPALDKMPARMAFYAVDVAGGAVRERLRISSDGTSLFSGPSGVSSARVEAAGSTITNADGLTVITQQKGDARYLTSVNNRAYTVEGDNLYPDYNMVDAAMHASSAGTVITYAGTSAVASGQRYMILPVDAALLGVAESAWITCEVSTEYVVSGVVWMATAAAGSGTVSLYLETGSVNAAGAVTSLGRTLIASRTDLSTQTLATLSLTTGSTARAMRFVTERAIGGTAQTRTASLAIRRKVSAVQMAADVDAKYAVKAAANIFTLDQTIEGTAPHLNLSNPSVGLGGSTKNMLVSFNVTGAATDGDIGYSASANLVVRNIRNSVVLHADSLNANPTTSLLSFLIAGVEVGKLERLGALTSGTSIVTMGAGDARYVNIGARISIPDGTPTAPAIYFGSDTNTGIYTDPAVPDMIGFSAGGSEAFRVVDKSIYHGIPSLPTGVSAGTMHAGTGVIAQVAQWRWSSDVAGPNLIFNKSRSNSLTAPAINGAADNLGNVVFNGTDGTGFIEGARISAQNDGAPVASSGNVPARLLFWTAPTAGNAIERMRITSAGDISMNGAAPIAGVHLDIGGPQGGVVRLGTYTKVQANALAAKTIAGAMIYVTDATGGATMATSNGTTWKIAGTQTDI